MIDRRLFLAGLAGTAVTAHARRGGALAVEDPAQLHRVYRRIRYAGDDRLVFWWMKGRRYGIVDNVMTPFFDMNVGSMHRCRDLGGERYEVVTASSLYFTDLASGELVENWANPVTGRTVRFNYPAPRPAVSVYSYGEGVVVEPEMPGMRLERRHVTSPVEVQGADAWLHEESWVIADVLATGRKMKVHDMYSYVCPVAALRDPAVPFVPAVEHFNDYNDWSPRFEMGDRPGTSVARCSGRKVATLDGMPDGFLRLARRLHPEAFRDPAKTLG